MNAWIKSNRSTILLWALLTVGSLIVFALTRGTNYQQLGMALLTATVALLVAMGVFEALWQMAGGGSGPRP